MIVIHGVVVAENNLMLAKRWFSVNGVLDFRRGKTPLTWIMPIFPLYFKLLLPRSRCS